MRPVAGARGRQLALPLLACAVALAGCEPRRGDEPVAATRAEAVEPHTVGAAAPGAQHYAIDADRSVVTLRVYRAGPLARLGHDHVLTSTAESGSAWRGATPGTSGFEVRLPVAQLVVDDPAARSAAGPQFAQAVPEEAREGTRRNLLGAEVLDAARFPDIVVRAGSLGGSWDAPVAHAEVTLRDRTRRLDVPLTVEFAPGTLVARGGFRLLQRDFGLTPFSVAGGAIQVSNEVDVAFEIRALAR